MNKWITIILLSLSLPCFAEINEWNGVTVSSATSFNGGPAIASKVGVAVKASSSGVSVSDNFNRADGGLGANWTVQAGSSMAIVNNAVETSATGADNAAFWNADAVNDDQFSKFEMLDTSGFPAPTVRASGTGGSFSCYFANANGIHKFVNNSYTEILSDSVVLSISDILEIRAEGTTISRYVNGVLDGSVTDGSLSTGSPGILQYTAGSPPRIDNWFGGDYP